MTSHFLTHDGSSFLRTPVIMMDFVERDDPCVSWLSWENPVFEIGWEPFECVAIEAPVARPVWCNYRSALTALTESPHV